MSSVRGGTRLKRGKGRKSRKNKTPGLSQEDIDFLTKNTKYDEAEIREWYKGFKVTIFIHLLLSIARRKYFIVRLTCSIAPIFIVTTIS